MEAQDNNPKKDKNKKSLFLEQIKNNLCKIIYNDGKKGTGFFCKISFPQSSAPINALMTTNQILGDNDIIPEKTIQLILYNDQAVNLNIDISRKIYTDKLFDITIIEIKKEDNLNIGGKLLEIDEQVIDDNAIRNNIFLEKPVYLIDFSNKEIICSVGLVQEISSNDYSIQTFCFNKKESSGGPMFNLSNSKIIGIHKGSKGGLNWKYGTFIKGPIEYFNQKYNLNLLPIFNQNNFNPMYQGNNMNNNINQNQFSNGNQNYQNQNMNNNQNNVLNRIMNNYTQSMINHKDKNMNMNMNNNNQNMNNNNQYMNNNNQNQNMNNFIQNQNINNYNQNQNMNNFNQTQNMNNYNQNQNNNQNQNMNNYNQNQNINNYNNYINNTQNNYQQNMNNNNYINNNINMNYNLNNNYNSNMNNNNINFNSNMNNNYMNQNNNIYNQNYNMNMNQNAMYNNNQNYKSIIYFECVKEDKLNITFLIYQCTYIKTQIPKFITKNELYFIADLIKSQSLFEFSDPKGIELFYNDKKILRDDSDIKFLSDNSLLKIEDNSSPEYDYTYYKKFGCKVKDKKEYINLLFHYDCIKYNMQFPGQEPFNEVSHAFFSKHAIEKGNRDKFKFNFMLGSCLIEANNTTSIKNLQLIDISNLNIQVNLSDPYKKNECPGKPIKAILLEKYEDLNPNQEFLVGTLQKIKNLYEKISIELEKNNAKKDKDKGVIKNKNKYTFLIKINEQEITPDSGIIFSSLGIKKDFSFKLIKKTIFFKNY